MFNPEQQKKQENILQQRFSNKLDKEPSLDFLNKLFQELPELEMYLVGGMVRDTIIEHPTSKDYDFIARGVEPQKLISVLKKLGRVDFVGRNFGVLKFKPKNSTLPEDIDIAFPRTETSEGTGGYRDVTTNSDHNLPVEEDLERRDLTINAIAWDVKKQEIIDPFHGQDDLKDGIIRAVGTPEKRFQEDYSRMLRAIRFACRFDFKIDPPTLKAIKKLMPHINDERKITIVESLTRSLEKATKDEDIALLKEKITAQEKKDPSATKIERVVPMETVSTEILKALAENPSRALELFDKTGVLKEILPEILKLKNCTQPPEHHSEGDVWQHTKMMLEKINSQAFKKNFPNFKVTGEFVLGVLLHDIGKPATRTEDEHGKISFYGHNNEGAKIATKITNRLKLEKSTKTKIDFMVSQHMFGMTVADIYQVGANKFAKRFLDHPDSTDLLALFYLDSASSIKPDGTLPMQNFQDTAKRIIEIADIRSKQPEKIISGQDVIQVLDIKPGIFIGTIILVIHELKDQGKINSTEEALSWLAKNKDKLQVFSKTVTIKNRDQMIQTILNEL